MVSNIAGAKFKKRIDETKSSFDKMIHQLREMGEKCEDIVKINQEIRKAIPIIKENPAEVTKKLQQRFQLIKGGKE